MVAGLGVPIFRVITVCNRYPKRPFKLTFESDCALDLWQGIPNLASHLFIKLYLSLKFDEIHSDSFKSFWRHNLTFDP